MFSMMAAFKYSHFEFNFSLNFGGKLIIVRCLKNYNYFKCLKWKNLTLPIACYITFKFN